MKNGWVFSEIFIFGVINLNKKRTHYLNGFEEKQEKN